MAVMHMISHGTAACGSRLGVGISEMRGNAHTILYGSFLRLVCDECLELALVGVGELGNVHGVKALRHD